MSKSDEIRAKLTAASRGARAPASFIREARSMLTKCYMGDIASFRMVNTRRGLDAFWTTTSEGDISCHGGEPDEYLLDKVSRLTHHCYTGIIAEYTVTNTRRGVDVFETKKRRL